MDVSAIKAKNIADAAAAAKNANKNVSSGAEGVMSDFSAAVAKRMSMGNQHTADRAQSGLVGAFSQKDDVQPKPKTENVKVEAAPRDDHQPRERAEAPKPTRDDHTAPQESREPAPQQNTSQDNTRNDQGDVAQNSDKPTQDQAQTSNQGHKEGNETQQDAQSSDGEAVAQTGEATTVDTSTTETGEAMAAVIDAVNQNGTNVDASKVQTTQTASVSTDKGQQTNANAQGQTAGNGDGEAVIDMELVGEQATKKDASKGGAQQAQMNMAQRDDGNHTLNAELTAKQQQAQDIASKLGADQRVDINVKVTKESDTLISKPTAALGAQAALADKGDGLSQAATQTAAKAPQQTVQQAPSHNLGNQMGQQQQGQDAQQLAQQNLQNAMAESAKNSAATDTKAQTSSNAPTTGITKVGGAEGITNSQAATHNTATQQQQQSANAQKAQSNPHTQHRAQVQEQINVQISKAIANGMDKISIQLKPAHLGRVDVQLEMNSDGRVSAVVTADNRDTLDLLKQDARALERAMREAGLEMNSGDLAFNLREGNPGDGDQQSASKGSGAGPLSNEPTLEELLEANTGRPQVISEDRVDITA